MDPEPGLLESQCVFSHQKSHKTQQGVEDARCLVGTKERTLGEESGGVQNDHVPEAGVVHHDCECEFRHVDVDGNDDDCGQDAGQKVHGHCDHCFVVVAVGDGPDVGAGAGAGVRDTQKTTGVEEEAAEFLNADHMSSVQDPRMARRELVCK